MADQAQKYMQSTKDALEAGTLKLMHDLAAKIEAPVMLDIGAHLGLFTLLAKFHPSIKVHAYEPQGRIFKILSTNVVLNDLEGRVALHSCALGGANTVVKLKIPPEDKSGLATTGTAKRFTQRSEEEVVMLTLESCRHERVDLIKLDVEGAELDVLRGGEGTIKRCKPAMLIEMVEKNAAQCGHTLSEIYDLLKSWGATWKQVSKHDILVRWPEDAPSKKGCNCGR